MSDLPFLDRFHVGGVSQLHHGLLHTQPKPFSNLIGCGAGILQGIMESGGDEGIAIGHLTFVPHVPTCS